MKRSDKDILLAVGGDIYTTFSITWPNNEHPQKFLAIELPITSELGKENSSLTWPCYRVLVQ
jgi:hypothetical protein